MSNDKIKMVQPTEENTVQVSDRINATNIGAGLLLWENKGSILGIHSILLGFKELCFIVESHNEIMEKNKAFGEAFKRLKEADFDPTKNVRVEVVSTKDESGH